MITVLNLNTGTAASRIELLQTKDMLKGVENQ